MAAMGKQVVDKGGVIVEVLASKISSNPSKADLDAWITARNVPVTSVRDPDALALQTLKALIRREYTYIVDLSTMKIVQRFIGSTDGSGISSAQTAMDAMLTML
jgi:hypothetical protein